jgi:hypothetical protein
VIAVRDEILKKHLKDYLEPNKLFKNIPNRDDGLPIKPRNSRYSRMVNINGMVKTSNKEMLNNVQNQLFQLTIIDKI